MSQFDIVLQELETIRDERRTHANTANRVGTAMIDMLGLLGNLDFLPLTGGAMKNSNLVTNLNADLLDGHHAAYFATASALETLGGTVAGHTSAISTLEGYFTGGVANRALRLDSDSPCTAWGQRFWQDGVPQTISGTLDGVENIIMSGVINIGGFVIEKTADGLKFNGNIYATGGVAALGATGASGGGGSTQYLRDLLDVNVSAMSEGQVLTYRNGYWTAEAAQTPSLTAYATKTWVQQQGYLTQHQSLAAYATQQWVNERGFAYGADLSDLASYVQQTYVEKVNGKGLSTNDFTNALLSKLNGIQAGANFYEHPTGGANTTITAASGKVLSAITVDNLGHVTSVGSKTLAPADIPALSASKITSGTLDTARIPDLSSIYLLKVAGESYPITNSLYIGSVTGRGVFVKDPAGNYVPAFYQNGENLWIGSTQTLDTHHRGQTYISAGYDGQHGNTTIYVCVPNDANNGGTNYGVWHSGNDGSGSGLDADLLDGHDSGYFATASALTTLAGTVSAQGGRITTLEGYFDNGVANSAKRLSGTNTYTAWGQTYWQNGVPKSISGAMTSVDSINALAYFSSSRVGIGKSTPSRKLHVYDSNRLLMRLEASNSRYVDLGVDDDGLNIVTGNTTNSVWVDGNVILSSGDIDVQDGVIKIGGGTISWNSDGEYFEFSHTIASLGGVSALGTSGTGGGGTITTQYLRELLDVNIGSSITAGHVLTYRNGYWVPEATQATSLSGYATQQWVTQQGYLTQHQSLAAYATQQWVYDRGFAYNADLQDLYNYAESAYVKALGMSGDNVTWTRNGITNNLTVPFATSTMGFKSLNKTAAGTWDANTMTVNGTQYALLTNYRGTSEWANMPTGMSWGGVLQITAGSGVGVLSGQLAWDSNHNVTTGVTRKLYWRSRNSTGWGTNDWHTIAFEDWVTAQLGGYLPLTGGSARYVYISNGSGANIGGIYNSGGVMTLGGESVNVSSDGSFTFNGVQVATINQLKTLYNFFDSRPASANNQYGDGKLRHYMATSSMTTGKPPVDAHIIHSAWDNTGGYDAQLAIGNSNSGLFFRTQSQGTWQAWKQVAILDNLNTLGDNLQSYVTTQLGGYLPLTAGSSHPLTGNIAYKGTKATYDMITFIDNVGDIYGNGIAIGGGGATIIGGGESAGTMSAQVSGGSEVMHIGNDQGVNIYTNLQNGWSYRKEFLFDTNGDFSLLSGVNGRKTRISAGGGIYLTAGTSYWGNGMYAMSQADASLGEVGFFGNGETLTYMYIGAAYNNTWMVVNPNGNVGIGTTTPAAKLDVNGVAKANYILFKKYNDSNNAGYCGRGNGSNNNIYLMSYAENLCLGANSSYYDIFINTSHNVGIGTNNPQHKLHVAGNVVATGAVSALGVSSQGTAVGAVAADTLQVLGSSTLNGATTINNTLTVRGNFFSTETTTNNLYVEDKSEFADDMMIDGKIIFGTGVSDDCIYVSNNHLYFKPAGGSAQLIK
jgi:hypothetical protein